MCSAREQDYRQNNGLIHQMETVDPWVNPPTNKGKRPKYIANVELMVKEYSRSAADKVIKASDVRPFAVLRKSVEYLIDNVANQILTDSRAKWPIIYSFVVDRLRAVRQDITVQDLPPEKTLILIEKMIPFYLMAQERCENDINFGKQQYYDSKLHMNEVEECFSKWKDIADDFEICSEKLKATYLLHYCNRVDILCQFLWWKNDFKDSAFAGRIFSILMAFRLNNFVAFFRLFDQLDKDLRTALWPFVEGMRVNGLNVCSLAYNSPNVKLPEEVLRKWLAFPAKKDLYDTLAASFKNMDLNDDKFIKFSVAQTK
uniref:SAC3/GANP/THP3 conserved domain-containing protein n=1 Tax=Ditylenchus dipsaci TaxID=166011 RepID=A0A915E2U7_9BILA